jgi:metacaspase-1
MNRALLVGINTYPGSPLAGCVNDVTDMAQFLVDRCGFQKREVRLLCDRRATTAAIRKRLEWLVKGAKSGDRLFFHYSGHGAQAATRDDTGEVDHLDEVICPVDFDWSDECMIRDDEFAKIFSQVPAGVEFVWISDSCHSGDLTRALPPPPHEHVARPRNLPAPADIQWRIHTARDQQLTATGLGSSLAPLNAALISGCRSHQTSADAWFNGRSNGALTYFLLRALEASGGLEEPLKTLIPTVRAALKRAGYSQEPELQGSVAIQGRAFLRLTRET